MKSPWSKETTTLGPSQEQFWNDNGYLVLEGFFRPKDVKAVNELVDRLIANPSLFGKGATIDAFIGKPNERRMLGSEAPPEAFRGPVKINDLFLDELTVCQLALDKALTQIIATLLDGAPMICNSLNFLWGSEQRAHYDTWYMPPRVVNKLVVSSICLEDVSPDAGPLVYYPGSHKLPPYHFSHGDLHAVPNEMPECLSYVDQQIAQAGIEPKVFLGRAGDVFLWHGQLLHGGSPINDLSRTRKTLVTHYWRAQDMQPDEVIKVHETGYYYNRERQKVAHAN